MTEPTLAVTRATAPTAARDELPEEARRLLATMQAPGGARKRLPTEALARSPATFARMATVESDALAASRTPSLPRLRTEQVADDVARDLDFRERIGEGGMGIVHVAEQLALRRDVAVKRTREAYASSALISEARVLGALEHPNIVPAYALGVDEHGAALMVMKRIEGTPWSARWTARPRHSDATAFEAWLIAQIEVLMVVCNAAHFAHTRDVLHRDLKHENAMIGEFGAVYVVD